MLIRETSNKYSFGYPLYLMNQEVTELESEVYGLLWISHMLLLLSARCFSHCYLDERSSLTHGGQM